MDVSNFSRLLHLTAERDPLLIIMACHCSWWHRFCSTKTVTAPKETLIRIHKSFLFISLSLLFSLSLSYSLFFFLSFFLHSSSPSLKHFFSMCANSRFSWRQLFITITVLFLQIKLSINCTPTLVSIWPRSLFLFIRHCIRFQTKGCIQLNTSYIVVNTSLRFDVDVMQLQGVRNSNYEHSSSNCVEIAKISHMSAKADAPRLASFFSLSVPLRCIS